jgi:lysophospholipase L1-like esterase
MNLIKVIAVLIIALQSCYQGFSQTPGKFKQDSRIVFVGNSITEAGFYESYIWLYYMTRFPDQYIEVVNAGIGGNTAKDILARFNDDVIARKPTTIVLTFGMNDSGYFEYNGKDPAGVADGKVKASYESFVKLVDLLKAHPGIEKIMMASPPYDETMKNKDNYFPGKSKAIERIIEFQKQAAAQNHWPFVDLYYPMQSINTEGQKSNPEFTIIGKDRIHPGNGGHLVMAYLFLKAQGLAGQPVAEVEIDAKKKVLKKNVNAGVSELSIEKDHVVFNYLAKALPFPVDSASRIWGSDQKQSDALAVVPFMQEFNQEVLRVSDLSAPRYQLAIDGEVMGIYTKENFSQGINLALVVNTPQYKQAVQIMNLNQARKELEGKMREYYGLQFNFFQSRGLLFKDDQAAYDLAKKQAKTDWTVSGKIGSYESLRFPEVRKAYTDQMKLLTDMIYKLNKPATHKIELTAVTNKN